MLIIISAKKIKLNTTFLLSGGAGRIITAIPALEEFHRLNPSDDFKVLIYGWDHMYQSHPILQERTYNADMKGVFDLIIKNSNLVCPEPYHNHSYYNQEIHLIQAFQEEIIGIEVDHKEITIPSLYLHSYENVTAKRMIQQAKDRFKRDKFIVFQPFGSGASIVDGSCYDSSGRSLYQDAYEYIATALSKEAVVLYFGDLGLNSIQDDRVLTTKDVPNADLRFFMAMIANCDYFVGVDSVGQHMARSFNKPGTVIMGSTIEQNVTYPDWFKTYRKSGFKPTYNPIRISPTESGFVDRINDGIMKFNQNEVQEILNIILEDMNGTK